MVYILALKRRLTFHSACVASRSKRSFCKLAIGKIFSHHFKMTEYYRPLVCRSYPRPATALICAGGNSWFQFVERITRKGDTELMDANSLPTEWKRKLTCPRPNFCGMEFHRANIMGILNVTPDSFSDGGAFLDANFAVEQAVQMAEDGADLIDIGGESTRPGAVEISIQEEVARVIPVIGALAQKVRVVISIDTRKAAVADAAFQSGARLVNDVSGFTFDPDLLTYCGDNMRPVCVMHSQGLPETMQNKPQYHNVVLDVFDFLQAQIAKLVAAGVPERCILADIGIGFGKTLSHNLALLNRISLFHGLGVPLLLGASRKGFIGQITGVEDPQQRLAGSLSVALAARAQGVQVFRVHNVKQTREAFDLDKAVEKGEVDGV